LLKKTNKTRGVVMKKKGLAKIATEEHKGIFYYINRKRRRGEKPEKKSGLEWLKMQRAIKIAKSKVSSRNKGSTAK